MSDKDPEARVKIGSLECSECGSSPVTSVHFKDKDGGYPRAPEAVRVVLACGDQACAGFDPGPYEINVDDLASQGREFWYRQIGGHNWNGEPLLRELLGD